jgi:hypothetical protein
MYGYDEKYLNIDKMKLMIRFEYQKQREHSKKDTHLIGQ